MNRITDVADWHIKIFDENAVQGWRAEFRPQHGSDALTDKAWSWCVRELQDKAKVFEQTGFVEVLDTGSVICKSDRLVSQDIVSTLAEAFTKIEHNAKHPEHAYHLEAVDVVDPKLFPLVYGRTPVLNEGGRTTLQDLHGADHPRAVLDVTPLKLAKDWEVPGLAEYDSWTQESDSDSDTLDYNWRRSSYWAERESGRRKHLASLRFQSLPCEIEPGMSSSGVRITSYINNLHPQHDFGLYANLEELIALCIAPWNACLIQDVTMNNQVRYASARSGRPQCGRIPARIPHFGETSISELPLMALSFATDYSQVLQEYNREHEPAERRLQKYLRNVSHIPLRRYEKIYQEVIPSHIPSPTAQAWRWAEDYLRRPLRYNHEELEVPVLPEDWRKRVWDLILEKALARQKASMDGFNDVFQPGDHFSYEDWAAGQYADPLMTNVFMKTDMKYWWDYSDDTECQQFIQEHGTRPCFWGPELKRYDVDLQEHLQRSGLQVFVRIGGIEPDADEVNWAEYRGECYLQGIFNEHIVATAMMVIDMDNVTECSVEFRQETTPGIVDNDWLEEDGPPRRSSLGLPLPGGVDGRYFAAQILGRIKLTPGRLIVFPNVVEHRITPFRLRDATRKGHLRFVYIGLCDPNYRLCSTRNVPAQQHSWWAEAVIPILRRTGLPTEICVMIAGFCDETPVSDRQAVDIKEAFEDDMKEAHETRFMNMWEEVETRPMQCD